MTLVAETLGSGRLRASIRLEATETVVVNRIVG
jgi:hypothetical protein